ncbi:unnamed protein product [Effrenium voratum]|nr:unnamed protein product [Effrenium voratum]
MELTSAMSTLEENGCTAAEARDLMLHAVMIPMPTLLVPFFFAPSSIILCIGVLEPFLCSIRGPIRPFGEAMSKPHFSPGAVPSPDLGLVESAGLHLGEPSFEKSETQIQVIESRVSSCRENLCSRCLAKNKSTGLLGCILAQRANAKAEHYHEDETLAQLEG